MISLCCSDNLEVRKFIFENLNTDWIKSFSHKEMYDKIYIHLKSEGEIPVSLILDKLQDEKVKNKLNTIVFELETYFTSSQWLGYAGFILLNTNGDTIAFENISME